jgi:RNA binding exosome subunit
MWGDIMRKIEVETQLILEVPVKAESWAGHTEAEDKVLEILNDIFKEAVDNFTYEGITINHIEVMGTQEI